MSTARSARTLDVFNLFDRDDHDIDYFYVSRLPGEPPEGVDDRHFHPVESRAFRLSLSVAYQSPQRSGRCDRL